MNLENERKAFLYELNGHGYHFRNTDWHDDWERFEDDQLNMVWEMWLASANRPDYVLVPKEPTEAMIDAGVEETDVDWKRLSFGYKAMIEEAQK